MLLLEYARTVCKDLLLPPDDLLLLALLGLWWTRRRPRIGHALIGIAVTGLWLLATPAIADALARVVERYPPLDLRRPVQAQAIVILGGGGQRVWAPEYGAAAAEPYLLEKLAYGAYLARKTGLPLLVTGFRDEAAAMRDTLQRNFDLTPRWVDAQAYDTFENARNSARLLHADGIDHVVLLTRATHMARAVREFTAAGMQVIPAPVGVLARRSKGVFHYLPDTEALLRSHIAVYELLGEQVRALFAWSHLRRQQPLTAG